MFQSNKKYKLSLLFYSALLGYLFYLFDFFIAGYSLIIYAYFIYSIAKSKNANGDAHHFAAYILGFETLIRASKSTFLPYEFGKYAIIILLLAGIFFERKKIEYNYRIILYFILLLPSCLYIEPDLLRSVSDEVTNNVRKVILFNLSGPLCLAVCILYFYSRKFDIREIENLIFFSMLAMLTYIVFLQFKVMSFGEIVYSAWGSNSRSSGGFAANQVSVAMGLGILMILVSIYLKKPVSGYLWLDILLLSIFAYRGLLTFSRGGVLVPLVAFILPMFFYIRHSTLSSDSKKVFKILVFITLLFVLVWIRINESTNGQLTKRYEGETGSFEATGKRQIVTGRDEIALADLNTFLDHPFIGVGPGMGVYYRTTHGYDHAVAAHVEYSRVLAEHGVFGIISLLILLGVLISSYRNHKTVIGRTLSIAFISFGLLTLGHNCMRTAAGAFTIGLGTMVLLDKDKRKRNIMEVKVIKNKIPWQGVNKGELLQHWI